MIAFLLTQIGKLKSAVSGILTKIGNVGSTDLQTQVNSLSSGKTTYLNLGSVADIEAAYDKINVYDKTVVGQFQTSGWFMFMGYKYTGGLYGMMICKYYNSNDVKVVSVVNGEKTVKTLVAQ